ncbi:hypothetical protein, partial [Agrococcus sp. HG114]|uniref:hypothetical protein n=1 Tax=Agrococcus sp. HG114 TaxID=2969757 RepID=UPI00215AAAA8
KWVNLTKGNIDWEGWKYVETGIDPEWELPLQLEQLYAVEQNKELQGLKNYKGCVYFDQIRFVYKDIDDLIGPEFIDIQPNAAIIYKDNFTISASVIDSQSGVNPE